MKLEAFPYDTVVVICPHGDDGVLGCGGLIKKLREFRRDVRVHVVVLTPGFRGVTNQWFADHRAEAANYLQRWLGLDAAIHNSTEKVLHAFEDRYGAIEFYGRSEEEQVDNVKKTAIRWYESVCEVRELQLDPAGDLRFFHFLPLVKMYQKKRVFADEIRRLRTYFRRIAAHGRRRLLLTPGASDSHETHQLAAEVSHRALAAGAWDIWHFQAPSSVRPDASVVVPLTYCEIGAKIDAARMHQSQVARRKYDRWIRSAAGENADALAEKLFGFGAGSDQAQFGDWAEVFSIRKFYRRHGFSTADVTVLSARFAAEQAIEGAGPVTGLRAGQAGALAETENLFPSL
jgi:LmbE family N-acetylglucosaminyl deacetylase